MTEVVPTVLREADTQRETWDDPVRGRLGFRTFLGGASASRSLTTGVADLEAGGWLGLHRHLPAEVYHVLEGQGVVWLDGFEHVVDAGAWVYIPGDTEHGMANTGDGLLRVAYTLAADSFAAVEYRFSAGSAPFERPSAGYFVDTSIRSGE
jgi:quercetin dioxygenase-like cupin family protein